MHIPVAIIGIGQTPVREHWSRSIVDLAYEAATLAQEAAGQAPIDALYVGNMLAPLLQDQSHLGPYLAQGIGLSRVPAIVVQAACASGSMALHQAWQAVASGACKVALVVGVEKMTDAPADVAGTYLATAASDTEREQGATFLALSALLMQRYNHVYNAQPCDFAPLAVQAHARAVHNAYAHFPHAITLDQWAATSTLASPMCMLDACAMADGAAALVVCRAEDATQWTDTPVRIAASAVATDTLALHDRQDPLWLSAVSRSAQRAYTQAGVTAQDLDFAELHDAFTIMTVLGLEANGLAPRGKALEGVQRGEFDLGGRCPISTQGGLKARGHPVGATGVYQVVEAVQQLTGTAGCNQVPQAQCGLAQNFGGSASTVVTHIVQRMPT